jgi:hypothetical protein
MAQGFINADVHLCALFYLAPSFYRIGIFYRSSRQQSLSSSSEPQKIMLALSDVSYLLRNVQ